MGVARPGKLRLGSARRLGAQTGGVVGPHVLPHDGVVAGEADRRDARVAAAGACDAPEARAIRSLGHVHAVDGLVGIGDRLPHAVAVGHFRQALPLVGHRLRRVVLELRRGRKLHRLPRIGHRPPRRHAHALKRAVPQLGPQAAGGRGDDGCLVPRAGRQARDDVFRLRRAGQAVQDDAVPRGERRGQRPRIARLGDARLQRVQRRGHVLGPEHCVAIRLRGVLPGHLRGRGRDVGHGGHGPRRAHHHRSRLGGPTRRAVAVVHPVRHAEADRRVACPAAFRRAQLVGERGVAVSVSRLAHVLVEHPPLSIGVSHVERGRKAGALHGGLGHHGGERNGIACARLHERVLRLPDEHGVLGVFERGGRGLGHLPLLVELDGRKGYRVGCFGSEAGRDEARLAVITERVVNARCVRVGRDDDVLLVPPLVGVGDPVRFHAFERLPHDVDRAHVGLEGHARHSRRRDGHRDRVGRARRLAVGRIAFDESIVHRLGHHAPPRASVVGYRRRARETLPSRIGLVHPTNRLVEILPLVCKCNAPIVGMFRSWRLGS